MMQNKSIHAMLTCSVVCS